MAYLDTSPSYDPDIDDGDPDDLCYCGEAPVTRRDGFSLCRVCLAEYTAAALRYRREEAAAAARAEVRS